MKLYVVYRTDEIDYDEYEAIVVSADSEDDAESMFPGVHGNEFSTEYLGETEWPRGPVLEAFNAG